jgi:putative transposase
MSVPDRRSMLDRKHDELSIRRQCDLLGIARSGVYRAERPANDNDVDLTRRIDELFTQWPFRATPGLVPESLHAPAAVD